MRASIVAVSVVVGLASRGVGAPKPVPPSPYLGVVYRYADAMLQRGRDTYGHEKTGLLLSCLNRTTFAPVDDRPLAVPANDQNLLRVLYTLSELSGKPAYRDAADAELKWLLQNAASRKAQLPPWDDHFAWDVVADAPAGDRRGTTNPRLRPWMLWDRCFDLDPESSTLLVQGLRPAPAPGPQSSRSTGFSLRALSVAFQRSGDDALLKAVEAALARLEAEQDPPPAERVSVAIDCGGAAGRVPGPLAERLRSFASRQDRAFCALAHDLKGKGGFVVASGAAKGEPALTSLWQARPDGMTTATVAMMCVSRYENIGDVRYREMIHAAADAYRNTPRGGDALPVTFGHAISVQLAAWRSTARPEYLECATKLADSAVRAFWPEGPLPCAGAKAVDYDTAGGADTLALALVELHLSILHITAVRCPPNTIDR